MQKMSRKSITVISICSNSKGDKWSAIRWFSK